MSRYKYNSFGVMTLESASEYFANEVLETLGLTTAKMTESELKTYITVLFNQVMEGIDGEAKKEANNMQIKIDEEAKKILTLSDLLVAKQIIKDYKDNEDDLRWDIETLKNIFGATEIISSAARISKNSRVYNYFKENSNNIDIWIDATFYDDYSSENKGGVFYIVGAYLTDIYQSTSENRKELQSRMYIRKFVETK